MFDGLTKTDKPNKVTTNQGTNFMSVFETVEKP